MPSIDENDPSVDWDDAANVEDVAEEVVFQKPVAFLNPSEGDDAPEVAALPEPVTTLELQGEPTAEEIAAAEAVLMRCKRPGTTDAPVSDKADPIKLDEPVDANLGVIHSVNGMDIITTKERIQVLRRLPNPELVMAREPPPVSQAIMDKTSAEQQVGRKTLQRHDTRAQLFPRPQPTEEEIRRAAAPVQIIPPGQHPLQHLLRTTPAAGKGPGY